MSPRSCIPCPKIENDAYDWYKRHETRCELAKKNSYDIVIYRRFHHAFLGGRRRSYAWCGGLAGILRQAQGPEPRIWF